MTTRTMEIEVSRRTLDALKVTGMVSILLIVGLVGWANSPRDGEGNALLLSPQRRAMLGYLNAARGWATRLRVAAVQLDELMPPRVEPAPTPPMPQEAQPESLYRRSQEAQEARDALERLAREAERRRVPGPLVGLHELVLAALGAHLEWADAALRYVGAPEEVTTEELAALRSQAYAALERLERAVDGD
jgi:hypothetical protein